LYSIPLGKAVLDVDMRRPSGCSLTTTQGLLPPVRLGGFLHGKYLIQSYSDSNFFAVFDLESYINGTATLIDNIDPLLSSTLKMMEPLYDFERISSYFRAADATRNPVLIAQDQFIIFSGKGHPSAPDGIFLIDLHQVEHFKATMTSKHTVEYVPSTHRSEIVSPAVSGIHFTVCGPSSSDESVPACHIFEVPSLKPLLQIQPVSEISWIDARRALVLIRPAIFLIDFNEESPPPKSSGGLWVGIFGPPRRAADKNAKPSRPFALVELDMACLKESIIGLLKCVDLCHTKHCDATSGFVLSLFYFHSNCSEFFVMSLSRYIIFGLERVMRKIYTPRNLIVSFVVGHSLQLSEISSGLPPFSLLELPPPVGETSPQAATAAPKPSAAPPKLQRFPLLQPRPALGTIEYVVVGWKSKMVVDFDPTYFAAAETSISAMDDQFARWMNKV
jgi:hypothetical protein